MLRPILKYGDQVLHQPARTVDAITPDIERLINDLIETMYARARYSDWPLRRSALGCGSLSSTFLSAAIRLN